MEKFNNYSLKRLNTFGVEARAASYIRFDKESEIVDFCQQPILKKEPLFILGGGSNLLFVENFDGIVAHPLLKGIEILQKEGGRVLVRAMAGENWDRFVAFVVANGWGGVENLSLIPGSVGASVVQNIGAYGVEVGSVVHSVQAVSLNGGNPIVFSPDDCGFGYRTSNFKTAWKGRFIITGVTFRLNRQQNFVLDYPGVEAAVAALGNVNLETIRQAIISIRKSKLPDPDEIGNAGSFFKNPIVDRTVVKQLVDQYPDMPCYRHTKSRYKLAGGWMIDRCGLKGKRFGRSAVHHRQALVLVNSGGAAGQEIMTLSEQVREAVFEKFGIWLEREVQIVPECNGQEKIDN